MAKTRVLQLALELKDGTGRGVASFDSNMRKADRSSRRATSSFDKLNNSLRNMLGLFAGAAATQGIISYINAWQRLTNQLRTVTDTNEELLRSQRDLFRISQETRQSLEATAAVYTRLSRAQSNLNVTSEEVVTLVTLINKAVATTGATTKEAEAGIIQLSQAFQSGQLAGDELRSVMENLPFIAQAISEGLGIPFREFRRQASKLQVEDLAKGLLNSADLINERFARTQKTFQQGFTILRNEMIKFFGEADDGLTITNAMGEAMAQLGKNLDKVAEAFTKLAYTIGAFMAGKAVFRLLGLLGSLKTVAVGIGAIGAIGASYAAGSYARERVNEFTGSTREFEFANPMIQEARFAENIEKVLEMERKGQEVGWEKVNYNLDQQLGVLQRIKRSLFGGQEITMGAGYRAVPYTGAQGQLRTEDLYSEGTLRGGLISNSEIIKIAMQDIPKTLGAIKDSLINTIMTPLKSIWENTKKIFHNALISAKMLFVDIKSMLLKVADMILSVLADFYEFLGIGVEELMKSGGDTLDHAQMAGLAKYAAQSEEIRDQIGARQFILEARQGSLAQQKADLEKQKLKVGPIQTASKGVVDFVVDAFQTKIEEYLKRKQEEEGTITVSDKVLGFFGDIIKGGLGYNTYEKFFKDAYKSVGIIGEALKKTTFKYSEQIVATIEGLNNVVAGFASGGALGGATAITMEFSNAVASFLGVGKTFTDEIERMGRFIQQTTEQALGTSRRQFINNATAGSLDRTYDEVFDDAVRLVELRDALASAGSSVSEILTINNPSMLMGQNYSTAVNEAFGVNMRNRSDAVGFLRAIIEQTGLKEAFESGIDVDNGFIDDLLAAYNRTLREFGELPKDTFESAVRRFSSQQTLQNISSGPQLLALFQEAFSEIANIDFGESDLSLAIEPLKDLTTNQIVQLEEMFVQTRLSAMEDGYNSLADQDQRLAQLYFEQEAIAARTQLRDAYELAGQDTFLQAQALDVFKNTIDSIRVSIQQANAAALQTGESLTGELLGGTQDLDLSSVVDTEPLQTNVNVDDLVSFQVDPFEVSNQLSEFGRVVADGVANFFAGVPTTTVRLTDLIDFDSSDMREAIEEAVSAAISDRRILGYRG